MFITPMQPIKGIEGFNAEGKINKAAINDGGFKSIFNNMIEDVKKTDASQNETQYLLATGQIDDAHTAPIEATKAQLSIELLVQMRNKVLEAHREIMQTTL